MNTKEKTMKPERIKAIRTALGDSAFDFAIRLKVTPYAIHKWEGAEGHEPKGPTELMLEMYEYGVGLSDELSEPAQRLFDIMLHRKAGNGKKPKHRHRVSA